MDRKHIYAVIAFPSAFLLLASSVFGADVVPLTPRQKSLPAGWFSIPQDDSPGAKDPSLTGSADIQLTVHDDDKMAEGGDEVYHRGPSSRRRTAVQRLQSIRRSVIVDGKAEARRPANTLSAEPIPATPESPEAATDSHNTPDREVRSPAPSRLDTSAGSHWQGLPSIVAGGLPDETTEPSAEEENDGATTNRAEEEAEEQPDTQPESNVDARGAVEPVSPDAQPGDGHDGLEGPRPTATMSDDPTRVSRVAPSARRSPLRPAPKSGKSIIPTEPLRDTDGARPIIDHGVTMTSPPVVSAPQDGSPFHETLESSSEPNWSQSKVKAPGTSSSTPAVAATPDRDATTNADENEKQADPPTTDADERESTKSENARSNSDQPADSADKTETAQENSAGGATDVLISSSSPSLSFQTFGPRTIVVGKRAEYRVKMRNDGDHVADNVEVTVSLPSSAEVVGSKTSSGPSRLEPDAEDNTRILWSIDRIPAHGEQTLSLAVIPRDSRSLELGVAWTVSPSRSMTQIQVQEPRLELSVVGASEVMFGEKRVYTITVSNPGTGNAENVILQLLPIVPTESASESRKLGNIEPGGRKMLEVELVARQAGRLQVRAAATADGNLSAQGVQEVMVRRANLVVDVEGPASKFAGNIGHYSIRVTNSGDATARDIVLAALLPAGSKQVSATDAGRWDEANGRVQWRVGVLRPGESKQVQLHCAIMTAGENRVELRADAAGDLNTVASIVTNVESLADLKLFVNDPKGVVPVGGDAIYEVRIVNRGTKAAENIQMIGYFSDGIEPVGVEGWRAQVEEGQVIFHPIRRLRAGQEMTFKITARATQQGNHVFRAELECADPETRLASEEWTRYYGQEAPALDVQKTARAPQAPPEQLDIRR